MKNKFQVQWKAKDFKKSHAWVHGAKEGIEVPLCEPLRETPFLNPARFVNIGKKCKKCLAKIDKFKQDFPNIKVYYE